MKFSENLRILRKAKGYSQEQLSELLGVSRQAVSKWESDQGYPELDKLMQLCEIFECSMDMLLKGNLNPKQQANKMQYEKHYQQFAFMISAGVTMIILGMLPLIFNGNAKEGSTLMYLSQIFFFIFVTIAVIIFVYFGIQHSHFKEKEYHPEELYTDNEKEQFQQRFSLMIASGIGIILFGLVILLCLFSLYGEDHQIAPTVFMAFVAIGVSLFVYYGIQKSKFDSPQSTKQKDDPISGIIMLLATIIFIVLGAIWHMWHIAWIAFPIGGILCGIVENIRKL